MMNTCYIVGGGPSLKSFDWTILNDKFVIAINRAYEVLPNATIVYFTDEKFWSDNYNYLLQHQGKLIRGVRKLNTTNNARVEEYLFTGGDGLDTTPGCLREGYNSGYAAINLAYHYGSKTIYLLGFDMKWGERKNRNTSHWHSGYRNVGTESVYGLMIKQFETIVEPLKQLEIEVFNVVRSIADSKLNTFTIKTFNEVFNNGTN